MNSEPNYNDQNNIGLINTPLIISKIYSTFDLMSKSQPTFQSR